MYTQCPHCQTCFRIAEAHLKVASGKVRCGSCQEVFDATQYLFKNLTDREPITDFKLPAPPAPPPGSRPRQAETPQQHVRQSIPPESAEKKLENIRRERANAPDQEHFMESVVGNNRYNDIDKMGSISVPGEINFGDSNTRFAAEAKKKQVPDKPASPQQQRTPYEDFENKESAATTADHDSIKNFYAQVDAQLGGNKEDDGRTQLDKDIDELLAFANGLKLDDKQALNKQPQPAAGAGKQADSASEAEFDLQVLADFEKELDTTNTGVFAVQNQKAEPVRNKDNAANKAATPGNKPAAPALAKTRTVEAELPPAGEPGTHHQGDAAIPDELPSPDEDIPLALRRSLDNLKQTRRRSVGLTLLLLLVILVLTGGLGIQVVLFRNVELAHKFPALIPTLNKICDRLPCRYSGKVDVSQIKLLNRDVRSHPSQHNALLISAAFINQAPFDQPYPNIQITMYDLGGNVVASRRFTPQEYLEDMYNRFLLMESGTPVHITLAVLDPGKDAINFEFSFQ